MPCTRNQFKLAAILLMLIDHIGLFLLNNNILFRTVGRLAAQSFLNGLMTLRATHSGWLAVNQSAYFNANAVSTSIAGTKLIFSQ